MDWERELDAAEGFEWDDGNAPKVRARHGVSLAEAEQVLLGRPLLVATDESHSGLEPRFFALGRSAAGRELTVIFTMRLRRIRVVSARPMSRKERRWYAQAQGGPETDSEI